MTKSIFIMSGDGGPRWLPPLGPALITWRPTGALLRNDEMYSDCFLNFLQVSGVTRRSHIRENTHSFFLVIGSRIWTDEEMHD